MSTPDLHTRATHFFLLAEQASRLGDWSHSLFWELSMFIRHPAACLPAMAAAARKGKDAAIIWNFALYPVPIRLSPEAVPWYDTLVATWKTHWDSDDRRRQNATRLSLVRLDSWGMPDGMERSSRLPEWLAQARQIAGTTGRSSVVASIERLEPLAALATWRPAPGVVTTAETLREWAGFWQQALRSKFPLVKGIAAKALLNLPEADLRAASLPMVPVGQLLHELATAIPVAAEKTAQSPDRDYLFLLDWQPAPGVSLPTAELAEVARNWMEVARHPFWKCREVAWQQLIEWDRTGSLNACRIDLLPLFVELMLTEKNRTALYEMAWRIPSAETLTRAVTGSDFALLRKLEAGWQRQQRAKYWMERRAGWLTSIGLYQAKLLPDSLATFLKAYLSAVEKEPDADSLLALAQWAPGPDAPPAVHREWQQVWQHRLENGNRNVRPVAVFALLRRALESGTEQAIRHTALGVWRLRTKADGVTHRLNSLALRLHEVRAHLAAGSVPDFEEKPVPPAQRQYPRLALPPGHIADREWKMENGELKMENGRS